MKRIFFFTALFYTLFLTFISYRTSKAYFADMTVSNTNTFTAAAEFPSSSPSATPTISITPSASPTSAPENIADHLVISEVQIDGGTGQAGNNDFIEIYNPTSNPINLNGMRLVKRTGNSQNDINIFTFMNSHIIPPHGYFLWAHNSTGNPYAPTINANVSSADTLGTSNSIAIRQGELNTGTIIDALSWDAAASSLKEGTQFASNPGVNESIERKAISSSNASTMISGGQDEQKGNGYDSNNNENDFVLRTVSQPQNSTGSPEQL